ncbi:hypothetical protein LINGRAHAP2_LOCUS7534, partial [Linum grandiflorum]
AGGFSRRLSHLISTIHSSFIFRAGYSFQSALKFCNIFSTNISLGFFYLKVKRRSRS